MNLVKKIISLTLLNFFLILVFVFVFSKLPESKTKAISASREIPKEQNKITPTLSAPVVSSPPAKTVSQAQEKPAMVVKSTPEPTSIPDVSTKCIISIDSQKYDVTEFRKIHSGGDVFKCGADMTGDFYARHDASYLSMMEKYKI